jgi:hypothetical protein
VSYTRRALVVVPAAIIAAARAYAVQAFGSTAAEFGCQLTTQPDGSGEPTHYASYTSYRTDAYEPLVAAEPAFPGGSVVGWDRGTGLLIRGPADLIGTAASVNDVLASLGLYRRVVPMGG